VGRAFEINFQFLHLDLVLALVLVHGLQHHGLYSLHLIFFVTYEWTQISRVKHYTRPEVLARDTN
jgi:hypothetical protein